MARKQQNAYQAWTYTLAGLLALTNAAWFLSSRITANDHAAALQAARTPAQVQDRVVYEHRQQPEARGVPAGYRMQRRLEANEQCINGQVISRTGNAWSVSGERCDASLL